MKLKRPKREAKEARVANRRVVLPSLLLLMKRNLKPLKNQNKLRQLLLLHR